MCVSFLFIFDRMGNNEIGLLLVGFFEFFFLGIGIILVIFYVLGNVVILNELFISLEIIGIMFL